MTVAAQLGAAPRRGWAKKAQDEAREGRSYKQWGLALKTFRRPRPRPTGAPSTHPSDVGAEWGPRGGRDGSKTRPERRRRDVKNGRFAWEGCRKRGFRGRASAATRRTCRPRSFDSRPKPKRRRTASRTADFGHGTRGPLGPNGSGARGGRGETAAEAGPPKKIYEHRSTQDPWWSGAGGLALLAAHHRCGAGFTEYRLCCRPPGWLARKLREL